MANKIKKSDEDWAKELSPDQFRVLRKKGTEPAFTGDLLNNKGEGVYVCAGCGNTLFVSDAKFDSGSGWPSFWAPASRESLETKQDTSLFMRRTEVLCSKCGGHLGHVFDDGPAPTGQRYCINSAAMEFEKKKAER